MSNSPPKQPRPKGIWEKFYRFIGFESSAPSPAKAESYDELVARLWVCNLKLEAWLKRCMKKGTHIDNLSVDEIKALEEAIELAREAYSFVKRVLNTTPWYLCQLLATALTIQFHMTQAVPIIDEAVKVCRSAVDASSTKVPSIQAESQFTLAEALRVRYRHGGKTEDIEGAIQAMKYALQLELDGPNRAQCLYQLSTLFETRFGRSRADRDLQEALSLAKEAAEMMPDTSEKAALLGTVSLHLCHTVDGSTTAVNTEAVSLATHALSITTEGPKRAHTLNIVSVALLQRFVAVKDLEILNQAISRAEEALEISKDFVRCSLYIHQLAKCLLTRFTVTNNDVDLDRGLSLAKEAYDKMTRKNSTDVIKYLECLRDGLCLSWCHRGRLADGERAICFAKQAWETTPEDAQGWEDTLAAYARLLMQRFMVIGALSDIDESIDLTTKAAEALPEAHRGKALALIMLADALFARYRYSTRKKQDNFDGSVNGLKQNTNGLGKSTTSDLDKSIHYAKQAIKLTPDDHEWKREQLIILSRLLEAHDFAECVRDNFDECIQLLRKVLGMTPKSTEPWNYRKYATHLFNKLYFKAIMTRDQAYQDEVDQLVDELVYMGLTGRDIDHPNLASHLLSLGTCLRNRYLITQKVEDLTMALQLCQKGVRHAVSHPASRILCWASCYEITLRLRTDSPSPSNHPDMEQLYQDAVMVTRLIPQVSSSSLHGVDKYPRLSIIAGIASKAAAVTLEAGKDPLVAVQLLEAGRGVMAESLEQTRTEISELRASYPSLADQLSRLQEELSAPGTQGHMVNGHFREPRFDRRYEAGQKFDALVKEIRQLEGFETFMGPPSESEVFESAQPGHIIMVNVTRFRCDAIIIGTHKVQVLKLPDLTQAELLHISQIGDLAHPDTLEWLWDVIAKPILDFLTFNQPTQGLETSSPTSPDSLPRIWWIPTGILTKFPLHAAGYHIKHPSNHQSVLDRVVSSYNTSIRSIIRGRRPTHQKPGPLHSTQSQAQALLIAMPTTPGHTPLKHTTPEISQVSTICKSMSLTPISPTTPQKPDLTTNLPTCTIFHFAGHGLADPLDPSNSQLKLHDWKTNPFRVSDLLDINLRRQPSQNPFLAYLSACATGTIKQDRYTDEAVHLVNGFLMAGFRHVIGTLWEVEDQCSVDMARITYESLRDYQAKAGCTSAATVWDDDRSVANGLHAAAVEMRRRWLETIPRRDDTADSASVDKDGGGSQSSGVGLTGRKRRDGWIGKSRRIDGSDDAYMEMEKIEQAARLLLRGEGEELWGSTYGLKMNWVERGFRKPELDDDQSNDEDEVDKLPRAEWVPYVHFGV